MGGSASFLTELKADPGQLGVETMLKEISKLERVRAIVLPADPVRGHLEKLLGLGAHERPTRTPRASGARPSPSG